jgi:hypothetical protein
MSTTASAQKSPLIKLVLLGVGIVALGFVVFFGWTAVETYVLSQRIHIYQCETSLRVGMPQKEVEDLFGVKPEDRKPPDVGGTLLPLMHDGVKRYREMGDETDTIINYTEWYNGLIVTSQHHMIVTYDRDGKVKRWRRS